MTIKELREEAQELIACGNSNEIAFGSGMLKVIQLIDQKQVHELWTDDLGETELVLKYNELYGK
jgi:selenocysteine lyase/cysteine desulfurase